MPTGIKEALLYCGINQSPLMSDITQRTTLQHRYIYLSQILPFLFTGIYGESKTHLRPQFWNFFKKTHRGIHDPWIILGDFNQVLSVNDKMKALLLICLTLCNSMTLLFVDTNLLGVMVICLRDLTEVLEIILGVILFRVLFCIICRLLNAVIIGRCY